ncbi:MAG TPA: YbhB/YbcL family Raf kinase inhibitor-like protein [Gemmatimonadales bacterium]|nr:YbhB/YbcL family Raf kinase inhibitor-like protein [Gemmatimonadales bacterium]
MTGSEARSAEMRLTSAAFEHGAGIPPIHTCDGDNTSPPLAWSGAPGPARSYALVCDDPDAPRGTFVHWLLYNIPGDAVELQPSVPAQPELPSGARQGRNSGGKAAYMGPCPPPGNPHRYFFRLFALDISLNLPPGATKEQLEQAMDQHILAQGTLMGRYQREAGTREGG